METKPSLNRRIIKPQRKKIIAGAAVVLLVLVALLLVNVKTTSNSGLNKSRDTSIKFATTIPLYYSFTPDKDDIYVYIHLSWTDGAMDLANGKAEAKIKATVYPRTIKNQEITWQSSNENVAAVDAEGNITAHNPGSAEISAHLAENDAVSTARLAVRQRVSSIFMTTSTMTLYKGGESRLIAARVFPENATNKNVSWRSKNIKVARVDNTGRVTPVGEGMTEIIATTEDGGYEGKCFVSVVNKTVDVEAISVKNTADMKITDGENITAVVTVSPSNAKNKTLKWSSDNEAVAMVNQLGRIRGVGAGEANITVTAKSGVSQTFKVEVAPSGEKDPFDLYDELMPFYLEGAVTYTTYDITLPQAINAQMAFDSPKIWDEGGRREATQLDVAQYINPDNYYADAYKYQFLDLSKTNNVSEASLNSYLADKGVLAGQGAAFIRAANKYNVSEVYLAAHACLETGNGTSRLATGIDVNGTRVYNVFGIGAYDGMQESAGSRKAYNEGWTSVESAIDGGAKWISEHYINSVGGRQNTLYKMRWNPENPGEHQYATDVGWAVKQAVSIEAIFQSFADASLSYDVPVYSGQTAPDIEN